MAALLPFSFNLGDQKKKSALDLLRSPLITTSKPAVKPVSSNVQAAAKAAISAIPSRTNDAVTNTPAQAGNSVMNRAMAILQQRQPAPIKPQTNPNLIGVNSARITAPVIQTNQAQNNSEVARKARQILQSRPAPLAPLRTTQKMPQQAQNNNRISLPNTLRDPLSEMLEQRAEEANRKKIEQQAQYSEKDGWKQYYDEEFKKVKSRQGFLERLIDNGSASRAAEQNARNRYANSLLMKAYDDNGNVIDQKAADLAGTIIDENTQVSKIFSEMERAKSRAIGASYDSDYYTGFSWDPNKNKATGNPLEALGKQLYATANVVRKMDVGSALLGADDTQKTDIGDAGRFLANLLPGMATSPIVGATNLSEAISGKGTDSDTGRHRDLDSLERLGRGVSGAIDVAGVFFGGSGDMLNSLSKSLFRRGASEVAEQAAKQTTKSVMKSYLKAMLEEGAEEGVQQAFEFFGDGGKLVTKDGEFDNEAFGQLLSEVAQSATLGAIGGGIFKGVGDIGSAVAGNVRINLANRQDGATLSQKVGGLYNSAIEGIQNTFNNLHNKLTEKVNNGSVDATTAERIEATVAKVTSDVIVEQAQKINVVDNSTIEQVRVNRITPDEIKTRVSQELDSPISMDLLDELWGKSELGGKNDLKAAQFEMLQKTNQMTDDYHTGIRSVDEILTFEEALSSPDAGEESYVYPDWTIDKAKSALESGKVTVYSSHPIENGTFVSPSKMMAQDYAGNGKVYSKTIPIDDVGWVNGDEGNYLPVAKSIRKRQAVETVPTPRQSFNEAESNQRLNDLVEGKLLYEEYSKNQSDRLWDAFQDSNGGVETFLKGVNDYNGDGSRADVSRHTISNNGALYRQLFDEYGRKPSRKLFNEALEDVLANGEHSKYYNSFKEFDPGFGLYNAGSDDIDTLIAVRDYANSSEYKDAVSRTQLERQRDLQTPKGEVKTITQLLDSTTKTNGNKFVTLLRGVSDRAKKIIKEATGVDTSGYNHIMSESAVRHALNRHGDAGELSITLDDIKKARDIIAKADTIEYIGKNKQGLDVIRYTKQYDNRIVYLEEVRNGRRQLAMDTMYKQEVPKQKTASPTDSQQETNLATDPLRASSRSERLVDNSVSQNTNSVNSKVAEDTSSATVDTDAYVKQQIEAQQKQNKSSFKQKIADTTAQLKHYLVDDSVAYEKYLPGKKNQELRSELREGVDRVRSSDMIARQFMEDNGLNEIGKMSNKALNTFQQYLIAKRAIELDEKGVKTGRNLEADKQLIESVGNGFSKQEKIVRDYNKKMLDYMADKGLISSDLKDQLLRDNPNYVPFNRVMEEIEGNTGNKKSKQLATISKQTVVQKIKGSDLTVDNPIESMMKNTIRMVNEGERNTVATKLASTDAFRENILAEGQKPAAGNDSLSFMVDGKKVSYEVPALVAQEMKNLNGVLPDGINGLVKVLGAPTRLLRTGATSANPMFTLSNLIRDQGQTLITGNIKANIKGTPKAILATFGWGKKAKELKTELSRNGIIGSEYRMTYGMKSGDLISELQKSNQLSKSAIEKLKHPVETLADVIGKTEYFTRAQQYFGTDGDVTAKSQAARNNTLNFSRGGSVVKVLNKVIPFLNAGVQGGRITVAQLKQRPVRTTLALAATYGLACAVKGVGEQQDKELWDRLGDKEKEQNLVIFTPNAKYNPDTNRIDGVIKIPMPQMLYPILGTANNFKGKPEDLIGLAGQIFTTITGIQSPDFTAESADGVISPVINQLTPTFAKPFLEVGMNKNTYTGNEIVSEYDSNLNPEDKGKKYTTGLARTIAKMTGIDAPVIDNFVSNWGGGLFQDLVKTMTDNPDNTKDGGGISEMMKTGVYRRFGSGSVISQYEINQQLAKNYKNDLKQSDAFKTLSADEQKKVLDAVDTDTAKIASIKSKLEQGREDEIKSEFSDRQKNLLANGMDINEYIDSVTTKKSGKNIRISDSLADNHKTVLEKYQGMKSEEWEEYTYKEKSAEYDLAVAKYENDVANGNLTATEIVKKEKELRKMKVSKDYDKAIREVYGLAGTKADIQSALNLAENNDERKAIVDELNKLNRAMYDTGVINATTYKTRNRNINNFASSKSAGKSSKKSSSNSEKTFKTPESGPGFTALLNAMKGSGTTNANKNGSSSKPTLKAAKKRSNVIGNYATKISKTNLGAAPKITKKKG